MARINFEVARFPLTPALSLGERENFSPSLCCSNATDFSQPVDRFSEVFNPGVATGIIQRPEDGQTRFPLPEGEGEGEGEQGFRVADRAHFLKMRFNDLDFGFYFYPPLFLIVRGTLALRARPSAQARNWLICSSIVFASGTVWASSARMCSVFNSLRA